MRKVFYKDDSLCTGCRTCEMVCSLEKAGEFNPYKSAIWILRDDFSGIDKPVICVHCKVPACEKACPVEIDKPLSIDQQTGAVIFSNPETCIGCYECVKACPFGAIRIDIQSDKIIKCDLCGGDPECVKWCATGAINYIDSRLINVKRLASGLEEGKLKERYRHIGTVHVKSIQEKL